MEKLYGLVKGRERRHMHEAQSPYGLVTLVQSQRLQAGSFHS